MDDRNIDSAIKEYIDSAENEIIGVWEIDGVTVYIKEISVDNMNRINMDWFTFDNTVDKCELGRKVEELALKLYGDSKCLRKRFSQICSIMKNTFGRHGRT